MKSSGQAPVFRFYENGEFVKGEIYVTIIDKQGVIRTNIKPSLIGVNMWEATDPDGQKISQLPWKATENSETAWITFKNVNPVTKKIVGHLKDEYGRYVYSEKIIEVLYADGKMVKASDRFGIGQVRGVTSTAGQQ